MHMKESMSATIRRQRLPEEDRRGLIYQHHVTFTEVLSESMPQVALHCLVLSEYGLDMTNPWSVFSQLSSLATSLICLVLAFGKVSPKSNKTIICQIHLLFFCSNKLSWRTRKFPDSSALNASKEFCSGLRLCFFTHQPCLWWAFPTRHHHSYQL